MFVSLGYYIFSPYYVSNFLDTDPMDSCQCAWLQFMYKLEKEKIKDKNIERKRAQKILS